MRVSSALQIYAILFLEFYSLVISLRYLDKRICETATTLEMLFISNVDSYTSTV